MTLVQLFTAIANAIRAKKGTSGTITASNFPTEIAGIQTGVPSGTLNITENGEYDVTNYTEANVNIVSEYNAKMNTVFNKNKNSIVKNIVQLPYFDFSEITDASNLFYDFASLTSIPALDFSKVKSFTNTFSFCTSLQVIDMSIMTPSNADTINMQQMFTHCSNLQTIDNLSLKNVTNLYTAFSECPNLINLNLIDKDKAKLTRDGLGYAFRYLSSLVTLDLSDLNVSNVTNMNDCFRSDYSLVNLELTNWDLQNIVYMSGAFGGCPNLSNESLNNILKILATATSLNSTNKTLKYIGLNSTQATTCTTLSNWQACVDAGWTTGY